MKNKGKRNSGSNKLIKFPNLEDRLLSKAMSLVEEKKYGNARELFGELLSRNMHDIRALYGWAVCSVELGDYQEAEEAVVMLLEENTPYYFDVFRLYLTILIERKDYTTALHKIMSVGKKRQLPPELKEFLRQMKKFCQIRLHEPEWNDDSLSDQTKNEPNREYAEHGEGESVDWLALEKADSKSQMMLLHNLADQLKVSHLPEIRRFLLDEKQHSEIKTMLLCAIKEGDLAKEISVRKFGHIYKARLESEEFLHKNLADQIEKEIRSEMDSNNPTLADLAVEMERMFTMNLYPKPLLPNSPNVWAAVFCIRATAAESQHEIGRMLERFHVNEDDYQLAEQLLLEAEAHGIWS
ncbi:tetratricopeptide repeat protein [Sporolactobacillus shoreicorticis]|uniref:Tetratricopeptide repeat protein n=1 Tax=Sporolactobacillus shoreicorticis TaxID=1923877 RepID=A0ABW5RXT2_9BACL|nr:tetratricopeptide repeat protein [Sporolactobacillus shoreicorticis]MCO7127930.1 tetratricopeptide repeat protein [Sporolactobacillus shoreicorticis]